MRKIILLVAVLTVFMIGTVTAYASPADNGNKKSAPIGTNNEYLGYTNDDGTITVTGLNWNGNSPTRVVSIPSTIGDKTVTAIGDYWNGSDSTSDGKFYCVDSNYIQTLKIPDTVTTVRNTGDSDEGILDNFTGLTSLVLPNNKDFDAFGLFSESYGNDNNIKTLTVYDMRQFTDDHDNCLDGTVFNKVTTLYLTGHGIYGSKYYQEKEDLYALVEGFPALTTLNVDSSEAITLMLKDCPKLNLLQTTDGLDLVCFGSIKNCPNLAITSINCNNRIKRGSGFNNSNIQTMNFYFESCDYGVDYFQKYFVGLTNLKDINIKAKGNTNYSSISGVLYGNYTSDIRGKTLLWFPQAKAAGGTYKISASTETIDANAFRQAKVSTITIPEGVMDPWYNTYFDVLDFAKNEWDVDMNRDCSITDLSTVKFRVISGSMAADSFPGPSSRMILYNSDAHTWDSGEVTKATISKNGKIVVSCTGCGKVGSTKTIYYPKTISVSKSTFTYNGKIQKPTITVKDSNGNVIANTNYTVNWPSGCKNVGKYTFKITFKGNYSGTKTKSYKINPKETYVSSVSGGKAKFTAYWKKRATQTTGYQLQYSRSSSFSSPKTVTISKNTTVKKTVKNLAKKKKYYVRVRTYKTVSGTKYYSDWSSAKSVRTK